MGGIEAGRNINMELEGGGKKAGWRREESWMEEGRKLDGGGKKAGWRREDLEVQSQQHIL